MVSVRAYGNYIFKKFVSTQRSYWCNHAEFTCEVLCIYNKPELDLMGNIAGIQGDYSGLK